MERLMDNPMPLPENAVEAIHGEPCLSHARRLYQPVWAIERDQSNSITNVELKDVGTIVEPFIPVGSPY
jgi:hypothetical protein